MVTSEPAHHYCNVEFHIWFLEPTVLVADNITVNGQKVAHIMYYVSLNIWFTQRPDGFKNKVFVYPYLALAIIWL